MQTFLAQWQNNSFRVPDVKGASVLSAEEMHESKSLLGKVATSAASNHYHEANALMAIAYNAVVSALVNMVGAETIVYDLAFSKPATEYKRAITRYRSYEELIPIALTQLNQIPETVKLTERYVSQRRALLATEERQANVLSIILL